MILLDTHCVLWMTGDDPALGHHSNSMVNTARAEAQLAISAIKKRP